MPRTFHPSLSCLSVLAIAGGLYNQEQGEWDNEYSMFFQDYVFKYHGQKIGVLEPHIFAVVEAAYRHLKEYDANQVRRVLWTF